MELRILIVVAPEQEEVLGGRVPALVRRSVRRRPSAGMSATASTTSSAGDGENRLQHLAAAVRGRLRPRRRGVRAAASCGVPMAEIGTGDSKAIFGGMVVLRSRASISPAAGRFLPKLKGELQEAIRSVCDSEDTTQYAHGLRTYLDLKIIFKP
jgi:hypothetical protein